MDFLKNKKNQAIIIIFILALAVRLFYFFIFSPPLNWSDCKTFYIAAENILAGKGYSIDGENPFVAREPGYSLFFLAPLYFITGANISAGVFLNIILSLVLIWLVFNFCKKHFSSTIGILAGLFLAVYPPLVAFGEELISDIPFTFLVFLGVYLLDKADEKKSARIFFFSGLVFGIATLTKSISFFLPFFILPFLFMIFGKNRLKIMQNFGLIFLGILIVILPYIARNYLVFDRFVFGRDDGGLNLWAGSYIPWDGEFRGNNVYPLPELTRRMDNFEADEKLRGLAIQNIKENPLGILKIWLKKPARMLFEPEFNSVLERENNFSGLAEKGFFSAEKLKISFTAINIIVFVLTAIGALAIEGKNRREAILLLPIIAYFLLALLPFSPDVRYKIPLMPFMAILLSVGITKLFSQKLFRKNRQFQV